MSEKSWFGAIEKVNINTQSIDINLPNMSINIKSNDYQAYQKIKDLIYEFAKKEWEEIGNDREY